MKIRRHSQFYNFIGDTSSGITFRWGKTFDVDPKFAPWPELADISISNHCSKGCDFCYRDSCQNSKFMSLQDYENLLLQLQHQKWGNVFQVALGGGEPLEHPNFLELIKITNSFNVIPNFTTNGVFLNEELACKLENKVGAVAISVVDISDLSRNKISILSSHKIKINIHYLLNRLNLKQAIEILEGKYKEYLKNINAIIFLSYKSLGRGGKEKCLQLNEDLFTFMKMINNKSNSTRVGFDACFVPMLMHFNKCDLRFLDPCECAFFSLYIDESLVVSPCSFINNRNFSFSLKEYSLEYIWEVLFEKYRSSLKNQCLRTCDNKSVCRGNCPFFSGITLCYTQKEAEELSYAN